MTYVEEKIIEIRRANPNATQQEIANNPEVNKSREYVRQILKKNELPTASALRTNHKVHCPECGSKWIIKAIRKDALHCRACGCFFVIEGDTGRVVEHGSKYIILSQEA